MSGKILTKVLLVILVVIIIAIAAVVFFANNLLKTGIEKGAASALKVGVSLDAAKLSIMKGQLILDNLVIKNPPGYQTDTLFKIKQARVDINIKSLLSDTIEVKQILLDGADVTLEQKTLTENNINEVLKSLPKGEAKEQPAAAAKPGKKLKINYLEISNTAVNVKLLPIAGKGDAVTMKLSTIKMTDLANDSNMDIAKLTGKILVAITTGIAAQGVGLLPDDLVGSVKGGLGTAAEKGAELLKSGTKEGADLGKSVSEGLKGLLKPKQ